MHGKNNMKKDTPLQALAAVGLAVLLLALTAWAGITPSAMNGSTAAVIPASTNTYTTELVFPTGSSTVLGLQLGYNVVSTNGTSTTTSDVKLEQSMDGANWFNLITWPITSAASVSNTPVPVVGATNLTVGAWSYVRVRTLPNTNANVYITNIAAWGVTKPQQ